MAKTLLLLNAPPRAGKDTAADYLSPRLASAFQFKMSQPLKDAVRAIFSLTDEEYDFCEEHKGEPLDILMGHSFRNWQIRISEKLVKEMGGPSAFGHLAYRKLFRRPENILVSSDTGFDAEVLPLLPLTLLPDGTPNVVLVHIHRPGCDYSQDSRSYIHIDGIEPLRIDNDGDLASYRAKLDALVLPRILDAERRGMERMAA